jgi:hypothetical protein
MLTRADFVVYLLYFASVVICVIKVGLLVRVRTALYVLPPAQRGLVTILADNNLGWCLVMVLTGSVIIGRVIGYGSTTATRYLILGALVLTSFAGLVRLGRWFLYAEDAGGDRGRPADALTIQQEIKRLQLLLDRESRRYDREGGIPDD